MTETKTPETKIAPQKLSSFGRAFSLMYNRSTMYDANHPYSMKSVDDFLPIVHDILKIHSPLVFIMNQEKFFIDEEPLDPRINTGKMLSHFKKAEILSISFYEGIEKEEIRSFVEIFTTLNKYPNANAMKKELESRDISTIKINHVFFKKVSSDEEIVSRDAYEKISEEGEDGPQVSSKKMFMDMVVESLLTEEFEKAITIKNITENPAEVSKNMIDADLETYRQSDAEDKSPGPVLIHQLQMMEAEVEKHLFAVGAVVGSGAGGTEGIGGNGEGADGGAGSGVGGTKGFGGAGDGGIGGGLGGTEGVGGSGTGAGSGSGGSKGLGGTGFGGAGSGVGGTKGFGGGGIGGGLGGTEGIGVSGTGVTEGAGGAGEGGEGDSELSDLAAAVFDMKRQLINGIELQKSLGVSYSNEEEILEKANEITDKVLIQLIKEEYKSGQISTSRLAHILKRLVPDAKELRRLIPKIKEALLEEGMPLAEYLDLVQELSNELESEELSKILKESAEKSGIDGEELVAEVKSNPEQAAELIYLAAEIRKGTGDESELTNVLVDYVEQVGSKLALDIAGKDKVEGEENLQKVITSVESQIVGKLRNMDVKDDVLDRLEERLSSRMDSLFETFMEEHGAALADLSGKDHKDRSILDILGEGVEESEELGKILKLVSSQAKEKGLNENDFKEIFAEINEQKEDERKRKLREEKPEEVLNSEQMIFFLEKEISRAKRYDLPFATLSFSVVSAKPKKKPPPGIVTQQALIDAILPKLASGIRGADIAAIMEDYKLVVLLPMTPKEEAVLALRRHLRLLNKEQFVIKGIPITVQVAGVATNFDPKQTPDVKTFVEELTSAISEMVQRIKTLHGLA